MESLKPQKAASVRTSAGLSRAPVSEELWIPLQFDNTLYRKLLKTNFWLIILFSSIYFLCKLMLVGWIFFCHWKLWKFKPISEAFVTFQLRWKGIAVPCLRRPQEPFADSVPASVTGPELLTEVLCSELAYALNFSPFKDAIICCYS